MQAIVFPFDDFTSLCEKQKIIIKIFVSISGVLHSTNICKLMFIIQLISIFFF